MPRYLVAELKSTPTGGVDGIPKRVLSLFRVDGGNYKLQVVDTHRGQKVKHTLTVATDDVEAKLHALTKATIPAFPNGPHVADGTMYELTVHSNTGHVSMGWHSVPPDGASAFATFADWLLDRAPANPFADMVYP